MKMDYNIYNAPTHTNLTVDFHEMSDEELQTISLKLRSIGVDIHLNEYSDFSGLNEIIQTSIKRGIITLYHDGVSHCKKCGCGRSYPKYKSGPNKGKPNYNKKPYYESGITFNRGFISFKNSGDYCAKCVEEFDIITTVVNIILEKNLPIEIKIAGYSDKTHYIKDDERKCYSCGKTMYESEMNRSDCIMGSATYPSECPHCKALRMVFGKSHDSTGNYRMLTLQEYEEITKNLKRVYVREDLPRCYNPISFKDGRVW